MIPTLTGQTLSRVDCETTLDLSTEQGWFLTIEDDYVFTVPGRPVLRTTDGDEDEIVEILSAAVGTPIEEFAAGADGSLTVRLAGGVLEVSASADFEPWSLVGPAKERIVSTPGGELAVWT